MDYRQIDKKNIHPVALEYYKNIAKTLTYYYENPAARNEARSKQTIIQHARYDFFENTSVTSDADTTNTFLDKANSIELEDSTGQIVNIFDLPKRKFDSFLVAMVIIDSKNLSDKITVDTSGHMIDGINKMNLIFNYANSDLNNIPIPIKNGKQRHVKKDPYWAFRDLLDKVNQRLAQRNTKRFIQTQNSDVEFWATVLSNVPTILGTPIGGVPVQITPQNFVDRISNNMVPGRLLISLPGGFNVFSPIVIYTFNLVTGASKWYDVGHVGIISTTYPGSLSDGNNYSNSFSVDIAANLLSKEGYVNGVQEEPIGPAWCQKHGVTFVGQIFRTRYVWQKKRWFWYWGAQNVDVDNVNMLNEAKNQIGRGYCRPYEVVTSKWSAPAYFICSSLPWYVAKKTNQNSDGLFRNDLNIGDWYKPTIFPAGVYLSDRVRIVDNTLN